MRSLRFSDNGFKKNNGSVFFLHDGIESHSCAFEASEAASIRIQLPRSLGVISVSVNIFDESLVTHLSTIYGVWCDIINDCDVYEFLVPIHELGVGLYFFKPEIISCYGRLYGCKSGRSLVFSKSNEEVGHFQMSVSRFIHEKSDEKYGGIIYHIFVDRFNRGGERKIKTGTINNDDWKVMPEYPMYPGAPLKNNHFYGGTLWGIIDKLPYLMSLGVSTIYLSPVFDAASNHKYDTADYMNVDSMFGGNEALESLILKAKEYGIEIILDGVFNHTGADSIYFNKYGNYSSIGAYQSKKSKYYSWFDFQSYPDKYTSWWGIDILPRINPDVSSCRQYFVGKVGVIEKYSKLGVGGFRLDVVDELSDDFVKDIKSVMKKNNPQSVLYGEVWEDGSNKIAYERRKQYYLGAELDGVMNYPLRTGIIEFLTHSDSSPLEYALTDIIDNAPARIRNMQMNLLGTHDTERILTVLGGDKAEGRSNEYLAKKKMDDLSRGIAKRRLRMAYIILATLPGIPAIFYGDEAGIEGYHDPFNRMPYPWGREDKKLIDFYRMIGKLRKENNVYAEGDFILNHIDPSMLVFSRCGCEYSFVTVVNNSNFKLGLTFSDRADILTDDKQVVSEFIVPEYTAHVIKIKRNNTINFIKS